MDKFEANYVGHSRNARKALVQLKLATEKEIAYMSDEEVAKKLNDSDYLILKNGDDYAVIPKKYEKDLVWICR